MKWFRNSNIATSQPEYAGIFNSRAKTKSGAIITKENAMRVSTVFSCIRVLSEGVGSLPIHLYKKDGKKKTKATEHPLYKVLHMQPNDEMNSMTFWEMATAHQALNGNFYAQIIRNRSGKIISLYPLIATNMQKYRLEDKSIIYVYSINNRTYEFKKEDIFEVIGLTLDGFTGLSPVSYQREALGLGKAAEEYGATFFENNATPPLAIEVPHSLTDDEYKRLKDSWQEAYSGGNAHKTALLEGGAKATKIGMSNTDSQFLETRKFQRSEIAGMFRVPLHLIGDLEKSSFSNISEQSQELVKYTLHPYLVRFERAINTQLLTSKESETYYAKFNVDGLLRGDIKSRYEAYNVGRNMGVLSANEIRDKEDMNPIDNGDIYLTPLNMEESGKKENND